MQANAVHNNRPQQERGDVYANVQHMHINAQAFTSQKPTNKNKGEKSWSFAITDVQICKPKNVTNRRQSINYFLINIELNIM